LIESQLALTTSRRILLFPTCRKDIKTENRIKSLLRLVLISSLYLVNTWERQLWDFFNAAEW